MCVVFSMREDYGFNYGETLRIRRDLYTILGKIRYIDTHGKIWYEYKLVKLVITRHFGSVGIRSEMRTSFPSCVEKHYQPI